MVWRPTKWRARPVEALGRRSKAALLPSHGAVCVGRTFEEAFHVARMVERAARQATFIRLLGGAPQMTLHDLMSPESYQRMEEAAHASGESVEDVLAASLCDRVLVTSPGPVSPSDPRTGC